MTFGQASDAEVERCRRETLAYLLRVEEPEELQVSLEEIRYMQAIRDHPEMRAIKRDEMLGVRGGSGGQTRKKLCAEPLKLIEQRLVSPGVRVQCTRIEAHVVEFTLELAAGSSLSEEQTTGVVD